MTNVVYEQECKPDQSEFYRIRKKSFTLHNYSFWV